MAAPEYWKELLQNIINKDKINKNKQAPKTQTAISVLKDNPASATKTRTIKKNRRSTRTTYIFVGQANNSTKITVREADCLLHFAKGKTISGTAKALNLSPRTVEYYLRNMKSKLKCYSKAELIEKINTNICLDNIRKQINKISEK